MTMNCAAINLPSGATVQNYHWTLMNQAVSGVDGLYLRGSKNESLAIGSLSYLDHLGDYQCGMTLSTGNQYNSNIITLAPSKLYYFRGLLAQ